MSPMSHKKYTFIFVLLFIIIGLSLYARKSQAPAVIEESTQEVEQTPPIVEDAKVPAPAPSAPTFKELVTKGHEFYLKGQYMQALPYLKKAIMLEENDEVYRSLYS